VALSNPEHLLAAACAAIVTAGDSGQEMTLNREAFRVGLLVGRGLIAREVAYKALLEAALEMPSYKPDWPWTPGELHYKIGRSLGQGIAKA
jgi:hypothetical protein